MFDSFSVRRKATKCKKVIRRVQDHLKLLKTKRGWMVQQAREDVAQLLRLGNRQTAFNLVEQILKDERILTVYNLLDSFCEFIVDDLPNILMHRDCPSDFNEAISTLIFASARCGELTELRVIRNLFGKHYGQRFTMVAQELLPDNLVNPTIRENLSKRSVSDDVKYKLMDELARSSRSLESETLALDTTDRQHKDLSKSLKKDPQTQALDVTINEGNIVTDNSSPNGNKSLSGPNHSIYERRKLKNKKLEESSLVIESDQNQGKVVYLHDIEELKTPVSKSDINFPEQRRQRDPVFESLTVCTEKISNKSKNKKAGSRGSIKRRMTERNTPKKRVLSLEYRNVIDVECAIYYGILPIKKCKSYRKVHQEKTGEQNIEQIFAKPDHPSQKKETRHSLLRAITMPVESRPKDEEVANRIPRSSTFPFEQQWRNGSCLSPHVHPKLPDYDDIAQQFKALKKATMKNQQ